MKRPLQPPRHPQNPPCAPLTKGGKDSLSFQNTHKPGLVPLQSQQNPPCAPLTKGGKDYQTCHKLHHANYEANLAPLDKGGWGDSNPFHPLIRQEESQPCN